MIELYRNDLILIPFDKNYLDSISSFLSNGVQDDCSPAQSLNKISASARSTRSTTNSFTTITPTSNTILPASSSPAPCHNTSNNLTIKSSKVPFLFTHFSTNY